MRLTAPTSCLLLALALTGGCGIKPVKVDPPASVKHDTFPKTYPDPATDPQPDNQNTER
jgi:hypothetical protein